MSTEPAWVGEILDFWFRELGEADWVVRSDGSDATTPRAMLAAVIVVDQFSRNLFRGTPRAFAADPLARRLAREAIAKGFDVAMKSEDPADQVLCVDLMRSLGREDWTRYAEAHKAIIDRFGRYPHRNAALGRPSTPEELAFLEEPGSAF